MISAYIMGVVTDSTINQINYIDIQLPLHWVDKTAVISEEEKDYFSYKVGDVKGTVDEDTETRLILPSADF